MSAPVFAYRASHRDGAVESGRLQAESAEAVRVALASRGLFPLEVRPERTREARRPRLPAEDLALGLRVLATLLDSGLPLARALSALDDLVPASWTRVLPPLRAAVREGSSLTAALAALPVEIPPLVLGLVQAGEAGSGLPAAVARAAELTEASATLRRSIRSALAYPLVLAGAGTASVALLVGFVLPRFAAILADLGQGLPPTTRLVLGIAHAVRAGFLPGLAVLIVLLVAHRAWTATPAGRERWHALLLELPLLGTVRRSAATARFASALSALLENGVPVAPALTHATRAGGDAALARRILAAREAVVGGGGIARALEAEDAATPTLVRLVRAGEETGRLAAMLAQAAKIEADRAEQAVKGAVRVLEPAMILVFGGVVGLVAAALLQAVYSVRPGP